MAPPARLVDDLLTPAELAIAELEAEGISVYDWEPAPVVEPRFLVLNAPQIHAFEVPPSSTLPVLGREGLIMEGAANLLYSYPKTGKTELLTAIVTEWVAAGMRVLYLTEEPFPMWKLRLRAHGCYSESLRMFNAWGHAFGEALEVIESEEFDILVVDTLRNTLGYLEGEGDKDVARIIHPLLRSVTGKTTVCSYHARKMPGEGGRDISGHHSLYGAFDRALQLSTVEGQDDHRRISVSGRCMYEGEQALHYRMVKPGVFEVLDGQAVVKKGSRRRYELVCLECGDEFEAGRRDAKFCGDTCNARSRRKQPKVDAECQTPVGDIGDSLEISDISDAFSDGEW